MIKIILIKIQSLRESAEGFCRSAPQKNDIDDLKMFKDSWFQITEKFVQPGNGLYNKLAN